MKQITLTFLCLLLAFHSSGKPIRERISFNNNWLFELTDKQTDASAPDADDSGWRSLNVPHDWSIEADFSEKNPATAGGGALPGGMGWYRKHFKLPKSDKGKKVYIDFDGVYRCSKVWLNGHLLGFRPSGYISFRYDLTPYLNYGNQPNVLAVQVDNSEQPNSRWYSGSGIFRNVWLVKTGQVHVDNWGTQITIPVINADKAMVEIATTLKNDATDVSAEVTTRIQDKNGQTVVRTSSITEIAAGNNKNIIQTIEVLHPELWSIDNPYLYTAVTEVKVGGKLTDRYETPFGIRSFDWKKDSGFYLNGKAVKVLGVCLHHDLGCLGAAINPRALERQLQMMKDMGANAIRTSHNPPAPELLDICDRIGLLVQDEAFDMWRRRKSPYDYAQYFDEWHERDLTDQLLRDRNHPSVFMWSIGNEVLEQWPEAAADTLSLEEANLILNAGHPIDPAVLKDTTMSLQGLIAHSLTAIVKRLDDRPVTTAGNETSPGNLVFRSGALDVIGFNYHEMNYEPFPQNFPGQKLIVSESTSALMTRGYYQMPSDSMFVWPNNWNGRFDRPEHLCSAYDNCHVPWGSTHEVTWREVKRLPHVAGMFIWTGFDYLGEPTPYWWPSRSSFFGIVDLAGFPKDVYYMYQSEWTNKPVLHVFPHWNWKEEEEVDIWAYYNQADEVELFLNGKSLGTKRKTDGIFHVCWRVPFTPGTLKAISRKNGQEVLTREIHTAGEAAQLALIPDRPVIHADGIDLSFVTVEVRDKAGNLVPDAHPLLRFSVEGDGFIAGSDNGDQNDPVSLKKPERHAFYGKAIVVVQNRGKKGRIRLKVTAEGFPEATTTLQVE
ncbi:sugar-binding domain-containing protein [Parabacteroides sp. AM08-6]|uniref:sugar-binding domain-containing protein n=1 Tax=Parabacteroides sp. AM08-6 TaxID=2292053 RepID=UPI000EFE682C|nr:sugar-binding domain-containing protein [Parabacteroides sp. AM08-6]RHJ79331.1 DUF4982 domain-containing protein [Parabacteroides sp. AM08-6]